MFGKKNNSNGNFKLEMGCLRELEKTCKKLNNNLYHIEDIMDNLDISLTLHSYDMKHFIEGQNPEIKSDYVDIDKRIKKSLQLIMSGISDIAKSNNEERMKQCLTYLEACRKSINIIKIDDDRKGGLKG